MRAPRHRGMLARLLDAKSVGRSLQGECMPADPWEDTIAAFAAKTEDDKSIPTGWTNAIRNFRD